MICEAYFSPILDTPIKPVVGLDFPRFFGVVEEEEEEEGEDDLDCRPFFFLVAVFVVALFVAFPCFRDEEEEVEEVEEVEEEEDEEESS